MTHDLDRYAETQYFAESRPEAALHTPFGRWVHTPAFPNRYDANQLMDCRCSSDSVTTMLEKIEELYASTGLPFRKIFGHHPETYIGPWFDYLFSSEQELRGILAGTGWALRRHLDDEDGVYIAVLEKEQWIVENKLYFGIIWAVRI